jgi:hypothetical protein
MLLFALFFFPQGLLRTFRPDERHNAIHPAGQQLVVRQRVNDTIWLAGSISLAAGRAGGGAVVWVLAGGQEGT